MGKFEDDLKKVRLEEKFNSADWRGFLLRDRFNAITQQMNNPPKSVEEFRRDLDGI